MPTLRSGLVIAGAYADKLRRTAFAQLRGALKEGIIKPSEVAFYVAQLNKVLYRVFVDELRIDKGDVVRVTIDYEVKPGAIEWKFDTLRIEAFRRLPDEQIKEVLDRVVTQAGAIMEAAVQYSIEKVGETADGDQIFMLKLGEREVGAFEVIPVDQELAYIKKGAALEPSPMIVEKIKLALNGRRVEDVLRENIEAFTRSARYVSREEAEKIIEYIKARAAEVAKEEVVEEEG
ncbi:MAG: DUF2258 domain-containing protein [Thermoprotei archaeon]|nr:MAG: DUF2258 domain-containing protein [Thermoprotei archaeon]